jgi:hypothetical protein
MSIMKRSQNYVVIDVQSGATGRRCTDRFPVRVQAIKLVREPYGDWGAFDEKREIATFLTGTTSLTPKVDFKSLLTPITGISRDDFKHGPKQTLDQLTTRLVKYVPADATVVCQADWHSAEPLLNQIGLMKGVHFASFLSLGEVFKTDRLHDVDKVPPGFTFNLATLVRVVLGRDPNPADRARDLADLFKRADVLLHSNTAELQELIRRCWGVLQERHERGEKSFATEHAEFEGVCLGHMQSTPIGKTCHCGAQTKSAMTFWF